MVGRLIITIEKKSRTEAKKLYQNLSHFGCTNITFAECSTKMFLKCSNILKIFGQPHDNKTNYLAKLLITK